MRLESARASMRSCEKAVPVLVTALGVLTITSLATPGNASTLWGSYRPNLYVGIRPRIPQSLLFGLMWSNADQATSMVENLRHTCEQDEGMAGYGWTHYDARSGGEHIVNDTTNKIDLTTWFIKNPENEASWSLRVRVDLRSDASKDQKSTVIFYAGTEDRNGTIECMRWPVVDSSGTNVICQGVSVGFDGFRLKVTNDDLRARESGDIDIRGLTVDPQNVWQAKSIFIDHLMRNSVGDDAGQFHSKVNLQYIQQTFKDHFQFDVTFEARGSTDSDDTTPLGQKIEENRRVFEDRFRKVYLPQLPFQDANHERFSQALFSNLLGGIGYFHGTSKVGTDIASGASQEEGIKIAEEQGPYELLSAVPSRSFFPRGFLWDEGFHLQLVIDYDVDLAMDMVSNWFKLMDEEGWIAREQILGPEARSKVPSEFQTQHRQYANPPTLFNVVRMFLDKLINPPTYRGAESQLLANSGQAGKTLLAKLYPQMKKHYEWFRQSQAANLHKHHPTTTGDRYTEGYQWRGRTSQHILPSGLDDYPRGPSLRPENLHIDALAWVGSMAIVLQKLAGFLGYDQDKILFKRHETAIIRSLDGLHWSEAAQAYCDVVTVGDQDHLPVHECHKGYTSLLPLTNGLLRADHPHLGAVLDLIENPDQLWSPHGLRSLSITDDFYGKGENYWRGPVWVNINYLVLERLLALAAGADSGAASSSLHREQAQRIYSRLRRNLVDTVYESWSKTGFAWEQYSDTTGQGQRTQHFTGWTALVVRIMAMPDLNSTQSAGPVEQPGSSHNYRVGSVFDYQAAGDPSTWRSSFLLVTLIMLAVCIVFRRRFVMVLRRCISVS